jgi:zinc/manganese transport system substrate-binding protein/manganese/iron transport system substrate-binding protein
VPRRRASTHPHPHPHPLPILISAGFAAALVLAACGSDSTGSAAGSGAAGTLTVVATTTQAGDFARAIGGDRAKVTQILAPNVDPHDYELSPADVEAFTDADVIVANGVGLEAWLDEAVNASGFNGKKIVMADGVTVHESSEREGGDSGAAPTAEGGARQAEGVAGEHAAGDPHIWHDPTNAKIMVANIERGFADADPEGAAAYQKNLDAYLAELDELDRGNKEKIGTIPVERRKLVTNHDAFGYYTEHYGITYVGSIIPSFDTSAELSGEDIDRIVQAIKAEGVNAVFSESSLPPRTAETIGREAGVKVVAGEGALYADTLGPAGSAGATYLEAERHNTDTIVEALR